MSKLLTDLEKIGLIEITKKDMNSDERWALMTKVYQVDKFWERRID